MEEARKANLTTTRPPRPGKAQQKSRTSNLEAFKEELKRYRPYFDPWEYKAILLAVFSNFQKCFLCQNLPGSLIVNFLLTVCKKSGNNEDIYGLKWSKWAWKKKHWIVSHHLLIIRICMGLENMIMTRIQLIFIFLICLSR